MAAPEKSASLAWAREKSDSEMVAREKFSHSRWVSERSAETMETWDKFAVGPIKTTLSCPGPKPLLHCQSNGTDSGQECRLAALTPIREDVERFTPDRFEPDKLDKSRVVFTRTD